MGADKARLHRYVLYCDEAFTADSGLRFHHFYGGLLIEEREADVLEQRLALASKRLKYRHELKWQRVTEQDLPVYEDFVNTFFDEIAKGRCRLRIMCLDKRWRPTNLTSEHREFGYHILYYVFISRAFGLNIAPLGPDECLVLRLFFDKLPDRKEKNERFKEFLRNMPDTARFQGTRVMIPLDGISEIDSRDHLIAQAVDVVIGALGFRMNRFHEVVGADGRRGKRTKAKNHLYGLVRDRMKPLGVKNIGITTGKRHGKESWWLDQVRLWHFVPASSEIDGNWGSGWSKK